MKTKALYAMIGLSIPIICVLIAEGILPLFNNQIPPLGSLFTCIGTISLSISILKYKFIISVHSKTIDKLFGDSQDFLIIINQDHEIISFNKSFLKCLDYTKDEIYSKKIDDFVTSNASSAFESLLESTNKEIELYLIARNNKLIPVSSTISRIENDFRIGKYYLLICRDLSERKQYEYDLFLIHKELEEKVVNKTNELLKTNESLQYEINERHNIEKALRESENRYKSIFQYAPIGIFQTKLDGTIIIANPSFASTLGYNSIEEVYSLNMNDVYFDKSERTKIIKQNMYSGFIVGYQVKWIRKDKMPVWIQLTAHSVSNGLNEIEYFEGFIININLQKRTEEEYKKSEERYKNLFENALIGIYRTTPDGRILLANPKLIQMLKFESFEELAKRNLESNGYSKNEKNRSYFRSEIERKGQIIGFETKWVKKDGSEIIIRENAKCVKDNNGNVLYYEGTVEDITDQVYALDTLRESEEKFRILAEQSPNMIIIYQGEKIEYVNEECIRILGYENELLMSSEFEFKNLLTEESLIKLKALEKRILQGEGVPFQEFNIVAKNGHQINVIISIRRILYRREQAVLAVVTDISERIKIENSLRESEERYRGLIENINEVYFISTPKGKTVYISPNVISFTGFPASYFYGKYSYLLIHKDDLKRIIKFYNERMKDGTIDASIEFRAVKKDGTNIRVEQITRFVRDNNNNVIELRSVVRDISERKMVEEKIQMLAHAFQSTDEAINILDLNNEILFVNDAFLRIYGYDENELIGKNILLIHSKNNPESMIEDIKIATQNSRWTGELLNLKKDGTEFPVFLSISSVYNENGEPYAIVGVGRDVSEQHKNEKQLEEYRNHLENLVEERTKRLDNLNKQLKEEIKKQIDSEEKIQDQVKFLQTLIDTIPSPIFIRNTEKIYISCNKAYEDFFDISKNELLGKIAFDIPSILPGNLVNDKDIELLNNPGEQKYESSFIDKKGKEHNLVISKATYNKTDGSIGGIVGIITDISEIKKLEKEIRLSLEHEKELSILKSRFISVASHEFRTPLTTILSSADLLEMYGLKWPATKYQEYIVKIQNAVEYMTRLINDVLILNKAEIGKIKFNPKRTNLYSLISEVLENVNLSNVNKIKIDFIFEPEQFFFNIDNKLVTQILTNILSNAVKYSLQNGVVILTIKQESENLILFVEDEGIGIDEKDLKLISEPFHRGLNVGTIEGTGLGLSIARNSAELHGGELRIESRLNIGTKVTIILKVDNI